MGYPDEDEAKRSTETWQDYRGWRLSFFSLVFGLGENSQASSCRVWASFV